MHFPHLLKKRNHYEGNFLVICSQMHVSIMREPNIISAFVSFLKNCKDCQKGTGTSKKKKKTLGTLILKALDSWNIA